MPVTRIVVPIDSQNPMAWKVAAVCADYFCLHSTADKILLLTHTKEQLRRTVLATHIGPAAKTLAANGELVMPSGAALRHVTRQTASQLANRTVVIVFFADDDLLEIVDGWTGLAGVIAVPDCAGQIDGWIERWSPSIYGQDQTKCEVDLLADKVVENALEALSRSVNLSHNIMSPRDRNDAKETLRILRAKNHFPVPAKVKSWAIRNGWKPGAAEELATLAAKISALKTSPNLSGIYNAEAKYEGWRN